MRIFLDTNVLASSIATRGLCNEVFESVLHDHSLLTCEPVLAELERVLRAKLRLPEAIISQYIGLLREQAEVVSGRQPPSTKINDPDDVPVLACAIAGQSDLFVTGDKALLELKSVDGLPIVSPRELWTRLAGY